MILWILLLLFVGTLALGALFYLVTRFRRFSFMRRLAKEHKALSWLLAVAAVGLLFLLAFVNLYTVVIAVLHLADMRPYGRFWVIVARFPDIRLICWLR